MGPHIEQRLNEYLAAVRHRPFAWHAWDCLQFTNAGWHAMHGHGWADEWLGRYIAGGLYMRADALRAEFGFKTIQDAITSKLDPVQGVPPRGALVVSDRVITQAAARVIGVGLGFAIGHRAAFLGKSGVITVPISEISGAWCEKQPLF